MTVNADKEIKALAERVNETGHASGIGLIAFGGSIAYGLDNENSDVDLRGFYLPTAKDLLIMHDSEQIERHDDVVDGVLYSAHKMLNLLAQNNPNTIEILGLRPEHVLVGSPAYDMVRDNADAFISRKCAKVFGGYSTQQLRRIKNALGRDEDTKLSAECAKNSMERAISHFHERYDNYNKGEFTVAIFNEDMGSQGISVNANFTEVPINEIKGMMSELSDIAKNADNLQARNRKKESGKLSKHMSHLVRLLRMGSELMETGKVNTFREDDSELLLAIKNGQWLNEDENGVREVDDAFWDLVNEEDKRFAYAKANNDLPEDADTERINDMVIAIHKSVLE